MAQVTVSIAGRQYRMACNDGEENHLADLARQVDTKINELRVSFGEIGDARLTVMAALTAFDELTEARRTVERLQAERDAAEQTAALAASRDSERNGALADVLARAVDRIERVALLVNPPQRDEDRF